MRISASSLGSDAFKADYGLTHAYVAGGMYRGIASELLVTRMARAGMLAYFGTGGLDNHDVEKAVVRIQKELPKHTNYGMNMLCSLQNPRKEKENVDLFLHYGVHNLEAGAYMYLTPPLVHYRLKGLKQAEDGSVFIPHRLQAKISSPDVAELFLKPPPEQIVRQILQEQLITQQEADASKRIPMADDICVEGDSGGHTSQGAAFVLVPSILRLRDQMMERYGYAKRVGVGAAGGIGTPEAAAAFVMGAGFILTGSINQCTVEAGTSDHVKDILSTVTVQDTTYAPSAELFELGAKAQVLKRGVFFPARANKLYELYHRFRSLDDIDSGTRKHLQEKYFQKTFQEVFNLCKRYFPQKEIERALKTPKQKMALIFKWYLHQASSLAIGGQADRKLDFQVLCGPSMGAFNQWVKGTPLENWRNRHVDDIALKLMDATAELLIERYNSFG